MAMIRLPVQPVAGNSIIKEAQGLKEVGFAAGIRANENGERLKRQLDVIKAAKIFDISLGKMRIAVFQFSTCLLQRHSFVSRGEAIQP